MVLHLDHQAARILLERTQPPRILREAERNLWRDPDKTFLRRKLRDPAMRGPSRREWPADALVGGLRDERKLEGEWYAVPQSLLGRALLRLPFLCLPHHLRSLPLGVPPVR